MEKESNPPEQIDPVEVELNLLQELIGENIIIILHQNGMSIMMDEDLEERSQEQMKLFTRMYVASKPSFVLRIVLIIEALMLLFWETCEDLVENYFKKS